MADIKQHIVYWGSDHLAIKEKLPGYALYERVDEGLDLATIFSASYRNALFLLGQDAAVWSDAVLFSRLPANNILYDRRCAIAASIQPIADLKNAHAVDFSDIDRLAHIIHYDFFPAQWGFKLSFDRFRLAPDFTGELIERAQASATLRGDFGDEWTTLATWTQRTWSYGDWYETFYPECQFSTGVDVRFVLRVVAMSSGRLIATHTLESSDFLTGLPFYVGSEDADIMVSVAGKGSGEITLGRQHVVRTREGYGHLFAGGQRHIDPDVLAQSIATYFDAGDLKPPLVVYFSGFNIGESFEGLFMMQAMGVPFLLISDSRLYGGAFYMGSAILENQILETIKDTLHRLGFGPHDVILTGLSMGTTGALYYGGQIAPKAIVVGKPLPDVGTVAERGRLYRPTGFETAADIVMMLGGSNDEQGIATVNEHFWRKFRKADLSQTILGVTYMRQDDYQPNGFDRIYHQLSTQNSPVQFLHKGWIGRHNDNTGGIVQWFVQIIRLILKTRYSREE